MKHYIGIKLSKIFWILCISQILLFAFAFIAPKLSGIEPFWKFWITALPLVFLVFLMGANTALIIIRSSVSREVSQVIGITLICYAMLFIIRDSFSLKSILIGGSVGSTVYWVGRSFLAFGRGSGKPPKLLSGKEFSKESIRNYVLLFLIGISFILLLSIL